MVGNVHGLEPSGAEFKTSLDTWSQRLADRGYRLGYFGRWHVERSGDLSQFGFEEYEISRSESFATGFSTHRTSVGVPPEPDRSESALSQTRSISQEGYEDYLLCGIHDEPPAATAEHYVYSRGIEFVRESADRDEPWCAVVSTHAPHDPYLPPRELYEDHAPQEIEKPANYHDPMHDKPAVYRRQREVWNELEWGDYAHALTCYYALTSLVDRQVGRIVTALEETGQLDETVIIYTSDHGDFGGAHRLFTKGAPPFEEGLRVPLVVQWPPTSATGQVCHLPVQSHDLAPTLTAIAGDEQPFPDPPRVPIQNPIARGKAVIERQDDPSFGATSLVPFLRGECPRDYVPEAYAEFHSQGFSWTQRIYWQNSLKYVFNPFGIDELYDLKEDPGETMNLIDHPDYQQEKRNLVGRIWEIARETGDYQISELHYCMNRFAPVGPNWKSENG